MATTEEILEALKIQNKRKALFSAKKMIAFIESYELEGNCFHILPVVESLSLLIADNFGFITKSRFNRKRNCVCFGEGFEAQFIFSEDTTYLLNRYFKIYKWQWGAFRTERSDECFNIY